MTEHPYKCPTLIKKEDMGSERIATVLMELIEDLVFKHSVRGEKMINPRLHFPSDENRAHITYSVVKIEDNIKDD